MKTSKLFANGNELHIEKRIGKGGEGEVFAISNMPGFALKTYLPALVAEREEKVRAMVRTHLADEAKMVAFPHQVVVDERGAFIGFVMRLVEKHKEIHELQTPSSRQKHFPKADYGFIVHVAFNIAHVFAQVHSIGCVVGDINQRGILVSDGATVALIDADSFQVSDGARQYLCVVGVPEYTPPELQGKLLKSVVRTTDHDAFGLAVCLFQLLCMDRHPFSGRYTGNGDMPLERAIAEYRFAYSARNTGMMPPPGTVELRDFTPKIAQLFEDAFSPEHVGRRPSASIWAEALGELKASLRPCSYNKLHRYARTANQCPWCRMEAEYGRPLFIDTSISRIQVPNGRLDPAAGLVLDIPALMAAINSVSIPAMISVAIPQMPLPKPSEAVHAAQSEKKLTKIARISGACILLGDLFVFTLGVPAIVVLGIAVFALWLLFRPLPAATGLRSEYKQRANAVSSRIESMQDRAPIELVLRKKAEILDAIDEFKLLSTSFGNVRAEYDKDRKRKQLDDHLSQFSIRSAHIKKVNSSNVAHLASFGFSTALDARRRDVQQVYGIGPVKAANIAGWVQRIEAQFRFQSAYTADELKGIQKVQNEIITKQQGLEEKIKKAIDEFRQEARRFEQWKAARDPELVRLVQQLVQTEADLQYIGDQVPSRPDIAPRKVEPVSKFQRGARPVVLSNQVQTALPPAPVASRFNPPIYPSQNGPQSTSVGKTLSRKTPAASTSAGAVICPKCGSQMIRRTARQGVYAGQPFWGCSRFPSCKGRRSI